MSQTNKTLAVVVSILLAACGGPPQAKVEMRNCEGKDFTKVKVVCPSVHYCECIDVK